MRRGRPSALLLIALAVAAILAAAAVVDAAPEVRSWLVFAPTLLLSLLVFPDLLDFLLRLYLIRLRVPPGERGRFGSPSVPLEVGELAPYQKRLHVRPWALVVSVFNVADALDDFLAAMEPYRDRLWVIDDGSTDDTSRRLRQAGHRCLSGGSNRKKPGAIRELLANLPPAVETVLVLDPDVTIRNGEPRPLDGPTRLPALEEVIFDFQQSGMAAATPRVVVEEDGLLARLQALEYALALAVGRKSMADHGVNSGVSLYRRQALASALAEHSLSVYAEDLENSLILLGRGERIYYDDRLTITTEAKRTWPAWFSQRVGWYYGLLRVYFGRFSEVRKVARKGAPAAYQFLVYLGLFGIVLHPVRVAALAVVTLGLAGSIDGLLGLGLLGGWRLARPEYFLIPYLQYTLLASAGLLAAVPRGERRPLLVAAPIYFFYALAQIVPISLGYANWVSTALGGRRLFRDPFQEEGSWRG